MPAGNIGTENIYHVPSNGTYASTIIDTAQVRAFACKATPLVQSKGRMGKWGVCLHACRSPLCACPPACTAAD